MIGHLILRFRTFKNFVGPAVLKLLYGSVITGLLLFGVESSFVLVLQGFLLALGIAPRGSVRLPQWYPTEVGATLVILATFGFLRAFCYFLKGYLTQMSFHAYVHEKRKKIIALSLDHAFEISSHEAVAFFSETIARGGNALQSTAMLALSSTSALFLFFFGLKIAPMEMLVGLLALSIIVVPIKIADRRLASAAEHIRSDWVQVNATLLNGIRNNFFLKIYGLIGLEKQKAYLNLDRYYANHKKYTLSSTLKLALPLGFGILVISIVSYSGLRYFHTAGIVLLSFFYIFIRFIQACSEMFASLGDVAMTKIHVKHLYEWERKFDSFSNSKTPISLSTVRSFENSELIIECDEISFRYPLSTKWIIENLSLRLVKGDCLVISGESGSGKSTLLSLFLGINHPSKGKILLNGVDIESVRESLFGVVGYVGPEPYLIEGSIRENLVYGNPHSSSLTDAEITSALKTANAFDFVSKLPQGQQTFVNEFAKISTGQKQRLAIARVLLRRPQILVLDECTSNLDSQNEQEVIKSLGRLKSSMTMIIVTHRAAFVSLATQTIILEEKPLTLGGREEGLELSPL